MLKPRLRGAARRAHGSSAERRRKIGAPAEAQRSGFGGVRRSKGANAVFAVGRNEVERTLRRRNRVKCTVARPKEVPLGEGGSHKARQNGPKHYPGDSRGPPIGAPPKPNVSGFGGERRSSGTTELLPRKAKRRMWSLRRRGTPFSPIFRRATKDGATGGRQLPNAAGKNVR